MSEGTVAAVAEHLALALQPLEDALADVDSFRAFLYRLGWEAESIPPSYVQLGDRGQRTLTHGSGYRFW